MKKGNKNENQSGNRHLFSSFLNEFSEIISYCLVSSEVMFGAPIIYEGILEDEGKELDVFQKIILGRAGLFTKHFMLSHIIISFEYYLEQLAENVLTQIPTLMLDKDGLSAGDVRPALTYDSVVKAHMAGEMDINFVARSYIKRFKGGDSYSKFIDYIEEVCKQKIIKTEDRRRLRWVFDLRNHVTHDGGTIDISKMHKSPFNSFELIDESIPRMALFEISHFLLAMGNMLEFLLTSKFGQLEGFTYDYKPMFASIRESTELGETVVNNIDGGRGYFLKAVERASKKQD